MISIKINRLLLSDRKYPESLKNIKNPPEQLYYIGNIDLLSNKSIAIIGSRSCSDYGIRMAEKFSKELTEHGICIVSGMAKGIDGVAHKNCLESGGNTIAVLGCGVDIIYPKQNQNLYHEIINNGGLIISEYNPGTEADTKYFPQRNRIVSGLSMGVLVIESAYRSGTSITAKFAVEQGKKVFCIPNNIEEITAVGNNRLIQEGAKLVTSVEDILEEYKDLKFKINKKKEFILKRDIKDEYKFLYNAISNTPISINYICKKLKCKFQDISYLITLMEIEDLIEVLPGNLIKRK